MYAAPTGVSSLRRRILEYTAKDWVRRRGGMFMPHIHAGGIAESQNIFVAPVQGVFAARESFLRQGDGLQHLILPAQGGEGIVVLEG